MNQAVNPLGAQTVKQATSTKQATSISPPTNVLIARYILLPTLLLTVALAGGVRVEAATRELIFLPPPLICLVLAMLVMIGFARAGLVNFGLWFNQKFSAIELISHALTLAALFFATAQVFNCVLPEKGLLHGLFVLFLLWSLINNLFATFDARRSLRALAVLLALAFVAKYLILASVVDDAETGLWRRAMEVLLKGVTLGALDLPRFAAVTGYLAFSTITLYLLALWMLPSSPFEVKTKGANPLRSSDVWRLYKRLDAGEQASLSEAIYRDAAESLVTTAAVSVDSSTDDKII